MNGYPRFGWVDILRFQHYGLAVRDRAKAVKGMRQIMEKFQERNGATRCKLLKGVGTGVVLRECPMCVSDASEFLEELLEKGA